MALQKNLHSFSNLPLEEQTLLAHIGNGPTIPVPHPSIHEAFERIAEFHPTIIAAKFGEKAISYQQLDEAANRLAHHLISSGLQSQQRVCLVVQRSIDMLIGIFAILKAGCQYVPIDGGVTSEQALKHIFTDTNARFIVCLPKFWDKIRRFARRDAHIFTLGSTVSASYPSTKPPVRITPQDGAYVIYTSGSTGKPKGVDVCHRNVTNALLLEPARLRVTVGSKVAQILNIGFDMGAWEILGCLMNGGTLHMRGSDWLATLNEVDTVISTPSILSKYRRNSFPNIKCVAVGGEPCSQKLADEWAENTCFYNICGPTEITILNSAHRHTPGQPLSIGKPIPNTTCYILDEDERPVPRGEAGVMWVGGAGVSRGYLNLPELTSTRFKPNKFLQDGSIMFNTGDIVRWRDDRSLEIFGRKDDQVKIKGFRVELDGVTTVIEKFPGITRATAMLADNTLCGFYTAQPPVDEKNLDAFVRKHLPYYSVPERWMYVDSIPLTANGKVNKTELSALAMQPNIVNHERHDSSTSLGLSAEKNVSTTSTLEACSPTTSSSVADIQSVTEKNVSIDSTRQFCPQTTHIADGKDPEKGDIIVTTKSDLDNSSGRSSTDELPSGLPPKNSYHGLRWVRHRGFILYRRFFSIVVLANVAVACYLLYRWIHENEVIVATLATATAANLCVAVLMRSEPVVNLLFTVFCSVPTSFPLAIRRHCARIFHIGGIHSGCALAAIMWYCLFAVGVSYELTKHPALRSVSLAPAILCYLVLGIFFAIGATSHPTFRAKYHNIWESTHRFGGWTCLILLWVQSFLAATDLNPTVAASQAYLTSPPIWLLTVATMAIIFPWLFLRKVAVRSEVLSRHAVRLWFDYTTPVVGTAVRLAERPLLDWHGFATITNPSGRGFSLIVSRAGDFTGRTIDRAPSQIYVRGIPTCGVLRIATLFKSVVLVATGSGIGPCLAVILAQKVPCRILWTAPNPEETFGKEIVDSVRKTDPNAVIWNTRTQGKPDMSLLAYGLWKASQAEAVCVISNKRFTTKVVYDMEARGIPAYGAIFDS